MNVKQKDIYFANLNPVRGSEQAGTGPVVVVSGNTMNNNLNVCIVCPVSSQIKDYPGCVSVPKSSINNLKTDSEIITFQVRAVSQDRLTKKIGRITDTQLKNIFAGLHDVLIY